MRTSWLWLAGALVIIGILSALATHTQPPSTSLALDSARPNGGLALNLWLHRIGYHVAMWSSAGSPFPHLPPHSSGHPATLMLLTPSADIPTDQAAAALHWLRTGGHLVLASEGDSGQNLLHALNLSVVPAPEDSVSVTQPLLLAPPASHIDGTAAAVAAGAGRGSTSILLRRTAVAASTADGPVLVERGLGHGVLWLLTARDLLDNAHLAHADNRRLLLNLVGSPGATLIFDTAQPPAASSTPSADWLTGTTWGIALILLLTLLLLYRWLSGWRLGPPVPVPDDRARPAAEYVLSMAGLLRRGHKRIEVLHTYQQAVERSLSHRYGVDRASVLDASGRGRLDQLLTTPSTLTEAELVRRARELADWEEQLAAGKAHV